MIFILNFNISRNLADIKRIFDEYRGTNINFLMGDFSVRSTTWSVPKKAVPGDTILFMCAKTARNNLGMAVSHIPQDYGDDFLAFVNDQKVLYKRYSGHLLGFGIVASLPEKDQDWWMSDIDKLQLFANPVPADDFKSFISINNRGSITYIDSDQWKRLKWIINQKNPGIFPNTISPDIAILEKEFDKDVHEFSSKSTEQLKKSAEKKRSQVNPIIVQSKMYYRTPVVAAYVKRRAEGKCQLCGREAPFVDQNGEPYLECHHIEWLSQGGEDSIDNCVALCPNCHRKMHIINADDDVRKLKKKALNK